MDWTKFKCKYCCDSGCDNPDFHDKQIAKKAKENVYSEIVKELRTIVGGMLNNHINFTIDALNTLINRIETHLGEGK